ncbi:rhodanese-like domain-containing protein [Jiella sonneratiae]|uniref:Rhodanese n=1 Tax=Jiella sonneratiae TaxID=2816856 RepID=A0ABS3J8B0_9HYPH|nr:rhodanese-like domain-containing protein [Jiella sonneratiae]MBO0905904.1 rhodanese [Jiella sonneratiae]
MTRYVSADAAKAAVHAGGEIAFLDLGEAGQFGEGHPLFAVPCPYGTLEERVPLLVPRPATPVLLIDHGDEVAERAARRLEAMGYGDVAIVEGGCAAWAAAGHTLYKGVNVPSKTLGELAEAIWHPPLATAEEVKGWLAGGEALLFDGRPPAEYRKMHVPGAVCLPNGELAHRLPAVLPKGGGAPPLVVGCAGRTRGIVGAIGLMLAGHDGPVYALENGTQGWALAGETLERGVASADFPALGEAERAETRARADAFAEKWEIRFVDADAVQAMLGDDSRTTLLFDVRSAEEAAAEPVAAAAHAPSGQMVQASDQYVGVRRARIVLCDDLGLRACLAAFWLRQLGFEPLVARIDARLRGIAPPPGPRPLPIPATPRVAPAQALAELQAGAASLLDLRASQAYRAGHVEAAEWATRARLAPVLETLAGDGRLLLVADDAAVLDGVLLDLDEAVRQGSHGRAAAVVEGGHEGLVAAGAPVRASPDTPDDAAAIDFLSFVHDRHDGNLEASRRYLAWETGLVAQLDEAERAEFRLTPKPGS